MNTYIFSKDGLAVRYSSNGQQLSKSSELNIFIIDSIFYIEKIQVKIVSDFDPILLSAILSLEKTKFLSIIQ